MQQTGIYKITHKASSAFYIGSAKNIALRWRRHVRQLNQNEHHSKYLQRVCNKHGMDGLAFEIVELCNTDQLLVREQFYLDTLKPQMNAYKIAGSPQGFKHSEETKRKQSENQKGRKVVFSEQAIANIRAHACKPRSAETKKKMSEAAKRRSMEHLHTPENIAKVAAKHRGMKRSEETKKKISLAKKGKPMPKQATQTMIERMRSPEMRAHLSNLAKGRTPHNKGKPMSSEQKIKISAARKGQKLTEAHKQKIREACAKGFQHTPTAKNKIAESKRKFTNEQVSQIRQLNQSGLSHRKLADMYGVQRHTIGRVINGIGVYG